MKTPLAVTLIVCGTLLVLFPGSIDLLQQQQVMTTLQSRPDFKDVSGGRRMSNGYTAACIAIGGAMIGVSIFLSVRLPLHGSSESKPQNGN